MLFNEKVESAPATEPAPATCTPSAGLASAPFPVGAQAGEALLTQAYGLALSAVEQARSSLMAATPFMDVALWCLPFERGSLQASLGCDGWALFVDPARMVARYRENPSEVVRDYLHAILHCVFRHPFDSGHDLAPAWDAACDIAVEATAMELVGKGFRSSSDPARERALARLREACPSLTAGALYKLLAPFFDGAAEAGPSAGTPAAAGASATAQTGAPSASANAGRTGVRPARPALSTAFVSELAPLFARDDHALWPRTDERAATRKRIASDVALSPLSGDQRMRAEAEDADESDEAKQTPGADMPGSPAPSSSSVAVEAEVKGGDALMDCAGEGSGQESVASMEGVAYSDFSSMTWQDISKQIEMDLEAFTGKVGVDAGSLMVNLRIANRKRYDYREFLKRFSSMSEEMKVSTEEFDYIYYTYGLSRYKNMPLVEPLEYQESNRVRDFVIAIDTSASCAGGLVRAFAEKTYDVLKNTEGFRRKVNIHIVQCDCDVTSDVVITELRDLERAFGEFSTRGFGGTDFRPVFRYVDDLIERRELTDLKGLIYFTDGLGKYPERPPDYETVFVFVNENDERRRVPPWAMKVVMNEDDILEL